MSRFEPGRAKTGGRKPGTPNKSPLVKAKLEAMGFDAIDFMAAIAKDDTQDIYLRFAAAKELAQYTTPKLKAVEHTYVRELPGTFDEQVNELESALKANPQLLLVVQAAAKRIGDE